MMSLLLFFLSFGQAAEFALLSSSGAAHVLHVSVAAEDWTPPAGESWIKTPAKFDRGDAYDGANFIRKARATSKSAFFPGTSTTKGDTLILSLDGELLEIVLEDNRDERAVAGDVTLKVLALGDQYSNFRFNWLEKEGKYEAVWKHSGSVKITGGTVASKLKMGQAAGGLEADGVGLSVGR